MTDVVVVPAIPPVVVNVAGIAATPVDVTSSSPTPVDVTATTPVVQSSVVTVTNPAATPVVIGTPGQGTTGTAYTHNQYAASALWTIPHGLGFYPNFIAVDSAGDVIEGVPAWLSLDSMTITFSSATAGTAYLS